MQVSTEKKLQIQKSSASTVSVQFSGFYEVKIKDLIKRLPNAKYQEPTKEWIVPYEFY